MVCLCPEYFYLLLLVTGVMPPDNTQDYDRHLANAIRGLTHLRRDMSAGKLTSQHGSWDGKWSAGKLTSQHGSGDGKWSAGKLTSQHGSGDGKWQTKTPGTPFKDYDSAIRYYILKM